jgi:hypothetical protein
MKTLIGALVLALAAQGATIAQTPSASPNGSGSMQAGGAVTLVPAGKKGPAGSAVLSQQGANLLVTLHLPQGYMAGGKAMIAQGECKTMGGASMKANAKTYNLMTSSKDNASGTMTTGATSGGTTTTLENVSLETLTSTPHVIVVQGTPSLCGDVTNLLPPQKP